jgi:hypothetical protein
MAAGKRRRGYVDWRCWQIIAAKQAAFAFGQELPLARFEK